MLLGVWRVLRSPAMLGLSLAMCAAAAGLIWQIALQPEQADWPLWYVLGFSSCYLASAGCAARAMAWRWQVPLAWRSLLTLCVGALAYQVWFTVVQPDMLARIIGFSVLVITVFAWPLLQWRSLQPRNVYDRWLCWACLALLAVHAVRTVVQLPGGLPLPLLDYVHTRFWWGVHVFIVMTGLLVGLLVLLAEVCDLWAYMDAQRVRDPLTQLLNRRGFDEHLVRMLWRRAGGKLRPIAHPVQGPWALLVMDLDHFKCVNDTWGHAVGDQVLQAVARTLQAHMQRDGVLARFGGEEFVLLSPARNMTAAHDIAEQVREAIGRIRLPAMPGQQITACLGVALLSSLEQPHVRHAFQQADAQLYRAKSTGRNRVASLPCPYAGTVVQAGARADAEVGAGVESQKLATAHR